MRRRGRRARAVGLLLTAAVLLLAAGAAGVLLSGPATAADFTMKNAPPSLSHPFGTDWLGRDMLARTLAGLSASLRLGLVTAGVSALLALCAGCAAGLLGRAADAAVGWAIDLWMGIPHILLLILISLACGKGLTGVVVGVSLTHWPALARVVRGEVLGLRESTFFRAAEKLGKGRLYLARRHLAPHLLPQLLTGGILEFPHAILHEASITFLGFGLPPEQPAIGNILSESMQYLAMGRWWLALFPGLALALTAALFFAAGDSLRRLMDPASAHE